MSSKFERNNLNTYSSHTSNFRNWGITRTYVMPRDVLLSWDV